MRGMVEAIRRQSIGVLALFVALGGTGYAATKLPRDSVTAKQIKTGAVRSAEIKNGAVRGSDVKDRSLTVADFAGALPAGPAGARGPQGERGAAGEDGAPGTARAYAYVSPGTCAGGPPAVCTLDRSKGVTSVTRGGTGDYCVTAPGLDSATTPALVSGDYQSTSNPETLTAALWHGGLPCAGGGYRVITKRVNSISVEDDPAADGSVTVADDSDAQSNNVSFVIVIP